MFIQFLHSETEHDNQTNWNYGAHFRKFVKANGSYIKNYEPNSEIISSELVFWCEWEPQSKVKTLTKLTRDYPQYLYDPYFDLSAPLTKKIGENYVNRQNTDPFVFGENFHFFVCRQATKKGYTELSNLQPGDVILFGSHRREWIDKAKTQKKMWYILDTVFVVSDKPAPIIYTPDNFVHMVKPNVSDAYYNISFISAFSSNLHSQIAVPTKKGFKLYSGATYSNPINGMFSFVPTLPFEIEMTSGFERPTITIPNVISNGLNTSFKISKFNSNQTKFYWEEVAKEVLKQGLFLGVNIEMPENKTPKIYKLENETIIKGINDCIPEC